MFMIPNFTLLLSPKPLLRSIHRQIFECGRYITLCSVLDGKFCIHIYDNNAISNTDTNGKTAWLWMLGLYAVKKSMPLQFYFHSILNRQRYSVTILRIIVCMPIKFLGSMAYYNFKKKYHIINLYPALERMYHQNRLYMIYNGTF